MILIKNVTKKYGEFTAVKNLTLEIQSGEVFGFLGVNGAGKTTTLKMLAGIIQPTMGEINICGFDLASQSEQAKSITGFIPDRPYLYDKLKAREMLEFGAEIYNIPKKVYKDKIDELLVEFGLKDVENNLIESFSHGMKQRLVTALNLVHSPKFLIVDEPMVGLDPHGAKLMKRKFREYAKSGMTVLLSTHSLNVAEEVSDRLAIIQNGEIIEQGTLADITKKYANEETNLENIFLNITSATV